jgi:hypothetical protein
LTIAALALGGCSDNEIIVRNEAAGTVHLHFRGEAYTVAPEQHRTIGEVPNGTYAYSTTTVVPPWARNVTENAGLSGTLTFSRNNTRYTLLYRSTSFDSVYALDCVLSSSDPVAGATAP